MIVIAVVLGLVGAVLVNGLADNLIREEDIPIHSAWIPRCRYCDSPRKFLDWSAVVSSLFFSGACRRCSAPRPFRDLLVEALLWIGFPVIWMTGATGARAFLIGGLIFSAFILFTIVDLEHRLVVVEAVGLVSLILILGNWITGVDGLLHSLGGGLAGFGIFLFLFLLGKLLAGLFKLGQGTEPLGFGDVILAALVGFATGWPAILLAIFASIFLGGIIGLIFALFTLIKRSPLQTATMAYGPYLMISGLLVYFYGTPFLGGIINLLAAY